jgi:hypothetical protein
MSHYLTPTHKYKTSVYINTHYRYACYMGGWKAIMLGPVRAISLLENPPEIIEPDTSSPAENVTLERPTNYAVETFDLESEPGHTDYKSQISRTSTKANWQVRDVLSLCGTTDHDPLSPWAPKPNALYTLLLQCPIFLRQTDNEEYYLDGDTSLAKAILSRMNPDDFIQVTVLAIGEITLIDDISLILKRPRSAEWIEPRLTNLVGHWIEAITDTPKTLASLLDISLAGLRKSKSRKNHEKT